MSALVVVAWMLAVQVGDAPPSPTPDAGEQPAVEAPAIVAPVDEAAPDDDNDDNDKRDDAPDAPKTVAPERADAKKDENWSMVNTLGATGCAVGGVLPAVSAVTALGLFYGGAACSSAASIVGGVGGVSGVVIGVPALIALAPCAVGGVACGAAVGAVLDDEEPGIAAAWTLPGLVVGTAGGALAAAGLVVASTPETFAAGSAMVAVGGLLALSGGPLAIAGASLTRTPALPEADEDKSLDDDSAVDVVFTQPRPMRF